MANQDQYIRLAHGSGGRVTHELLKEIVFPALGVRTEDSECDAADCRIPLDEPGGRLAFTTDGFVVQPLRFPGGTIGKLAACGTINDLAVSGAHPYVLSCSLIIEEGFPISELRDYLNDLRCETDALGIRVITGDTKVVRKGEADGLYITTCGIGVVCQDWQLSPHKLDDGDVILVSGWLGDHGAAVLTARESWSIEGRFSSDCKALWPLVHQLQPYSGAIRFMRDPTRGGLAAVLHEVSETTGRRICISESALPIREDVRSFCEILGLNALHLAGEGCLVLVASAESAETVLQALRSHPDGQMSARIGTVGAIGNPGVILEGLYGGSRSLEYPVGEQLPRIC